MCLPETPGEKGAGPPSAGASGLPGADGEAAEGGEIRWGLGRGHRARGGNCRARGGDTGPGADTVGLVRRGMQG